MKAREKYPRAIRWTHWLNGPVLALMIWSGVLIYWADDGYIAIPEGLASALHIGARLSEGMAWHFSIAWLFAINGLVYFTYLLISGEWREIAPKRGTLRDAIGVMLHDLHLRKSLPPQSGKLNGAQRIAYTSVILMGLGSVVTGLAIYKPVQLGWLRTLLGGYRAARFEHFLLTVGYVGFFFIHVAQVARAGWNNLRAMIAGFEVDPE